MTSLLYMLGIAILLYLCVAAGLYLVQDRLIYFPSPEIFAPNQEHVFLPSDQGRIKVWIQKPRSSRTLQGNATTNLVSDTRPAVIYFGGNAEQVGSSLNLYATLLPQHTLYFMEYRGYGSSDGQANEEHNLRDALTLYEFVSERHESVSAIGRSLGSGVAAHLARIRYIEGLVLITPFDSLAQVAQDRFPWLPVKLLLKDHYPSLAHAPHIRAHVLIIAAQDDEIIPEKNTLRLIQHFKHGKPKSFQSIVIPEAGHNDLQNYTEFSAAITSFFDTKHHRGMQRDDTPNIEHAIP